MGLIKTKISNLKEADIYSILLFALAKLRDIPEYSALSELSFILDKQSLVKLCQVFGGLTIKIPTLSELEDISYALLLYQYVDINKIKLDDAFKLLETSDINIRTIKDTYFKIKDLLAEYEISSRGI